MERANSGVDDEHVIDITSSSDSSSSSSSYDRLSGFLEDRTPSRPVYQPQQFSASVSNPRNASLLRRGNNRGRQRRLLDSGLWISFQLVLTASQIFAAVVVLSLSGNEKPHAPLKAWIVGYSSGCLAFLLALYWRFKYRDYSAEQDSSQSNISTVPLTGRFIDEEGRWTTGAATRSTPRIKAFVENFKMALDCFFAVWFVVGNVWIFGGHASSSEAPNIYRLCIVFLTLSCIGYALPFILCAAVCCCFPCIISVMGLRQDLPHTKGATQNLINTLPTYKFKLKKNKNNNDKEKVPSAAVDGGIVASGTDKEREVSGEDAVCCICLTKYMNNDELRELPCAHFFHKDCVDKWLRMSGSCPLCKAELGDDTVFSSLAEATASLRNGTLL
ncbi:E3 ubiquitin-protein ligase At1g63170-like [Andrographis paniculata]|uniref:E3 ubiquitin-protein ligase At1g63170-like n=1 Tax=Andrographis paniculata TaxID=175694 RepID=UPI0021E8D776|nr:E3 ubiquitin-protein ligase At1g63170-like [Andrographis paniculata]XP_051137696.1 E3 ubiquitin-protein ligase At1g63170-like [Andrographis paniculata]XP_051137697.1 E3 ubiquitin-protein ligase At1g63170-like [Andrographis paniculata]